GDTCTTLELGTNAPTLPIAGPPGFAYTNAWRGPCDGSKPPTFAIGGLGQVTPGTTGQLFQFPRYDIHVVVFFDSGTGVAEGVRIDKDDVAVTALCTSNPCPTCTGACALDATYTFTTSGGLAFYRNSTVLAPPVSYVHIQRPEAGTGAEMSCAPPFPACGGDAIDVADVMTAVSDPEVRDAFERSKGAGTTPFYGEDHRGGDGVAFQIQRDDGGGFLIGAACPDPSPRPCMPIPPGLSRLLSLLLALDQQQVAADPTCAFRRP
ncbi:MAG TPA: hypothetical protein VN903_18745, partial [Polyangia bacterium]|nr:hypothetical protein [Polyangia bacterium]